MSLSIERMISDIYSGMSSPSAGWARRDMDLEKKKVLDEENRRKMDLQAMMEEGSTKRTDLTNAGALARQGLANAGSAAETNIREGGLNARQLVAQTFEGGKFDKTHELSKETADRNYEIGSRKLTQEVDSARYTGAGEQVKGATALINDINTSEADKLPARQFLLSQFGGSKFQPKGQPDGLIPERAGVVPSAMATPAPTGIPTPQGAQSMEFASSDVLAKRALLKRNKKIEEEMFGKKRP